MTNFGEKLRRARQDKGWNQEDLAKAVNISQAAISQFEKGQRMPTPANIEKFSEVLGISKDMLVGEEIGEFERVKLMRNIQSLSPDSVRKINDIVEMIRNSDNNKRRDSK
jgi:transcriptional regulator with XRE-family HTH domain